jgi:CheY-like chemotaxis protein
VTIVDDDRDIAELIRSVLVDEGYQVTCVHHDLDRDTMRELLASTQPDCVLLDGLGDSTSYGGSWEIASWLSTLEPSVAVVMITAHSVDAGEAKLGTSIRARAAEFAAVVTKPFELDELLAAVSRATQTGDDRRTADAETRARISEMIERLRQRGAREIGGSSRRAWVTFRSPAGELMQLYRWERLSSYYLGRYTPDGRQMEPLGEFAELDAALALALPTPRRRDPTVS